jgi:hypothetical protein
MNSDSSTLLYDESHFISLKFAIFWGNAWRRVETITTLRRIIPQKTALFINIAAEASNQHFISLIKVPEHDASAHSRFVPQHHRCNGVLTRSQ